MTAYGAKADGKTDDTAAINKAIAALKTGDTLLFSCGTYLVTGQLSIGISNVTIDGSGCTVIHSTGQGTVFVVGGSGNADPSYGPAVALSSTAGELSTSFTTVSNINAAPGGYVLLQQGGEDSSTGSGNTSCDTGGCRGELLKVASVSGTTVTVTTELHDTYNPSLNGATAQVLLNPLKGITVENIVFDGNGSKTYGLALAGVVDSHVSGVTSRNTLGSALLNRGDFNVAWSNIVVTQAGSENCGSAAWFENQGNLVVNGMSVSNENPGAYLANNNCIGDGAFGFDSLDRRTAKSTILP